MWKVTTLLLVSVLQGGCVSQQAAAEIEVLDGCLFRIRGISNVEAKNLAKTWEFNTGCEVEIRSRARSSDPDQAMDMDGRDDKRERELIDVEEAIIKANSERRQVERRIVKYPDNPNLQGEWEQIRMLLDVLNRQKTCLKDRTAEGCK